MDSLDAQADAEPVLSSSDSEAAVASFSSSSNSSSGSPSVPYHMAMHHQHPQRPDSPSDTDNFNSTHTPQQLTFKHTHHNSDALFNLHSGQNNTHSMYNNIHSASDYPPELEGQKQHPPKMSNGFPTFRQSTSFTNFPNNIRPRHQNSILGNHQYRDSSINFSSAYPTAADVFAPVTPLAHMTSPTQQHQSAANPYENLHQGRGFDYAGSQATASFGAQSKQPYIGDAFGSVPPSAMLPSHQSGKPGHAHSQPHYSHNSVAQPPYSNGPQIHSQTPYGPHLQTGGQGLGQPVASTMGHPNGPPPNAAQEEISTIFVVGFPDDMQVCRPQP